VAVATRDLVMVAAATTPRAMRLAMPLVDMEVNTLPLCPVCAVLLLPWHLESVAEFCPRMIFRLANTISLGDRGGYGGGGGGGGGYGGGGYGGGGGGGYPAAAAAAPRDGTPCDLCVTCGCLAGYREGDRGGDYHRDYRDGAAATHGPDLAYTHAPHTGRAPVPNAQMIVS
jgi:hypothetical protein